MAGLLSAVRHMAASRRDGQPRQTAGGGLTESDARRGLNAGGIHYATGSSAAYRSVMNAETNADTSSGFSP